jgi:hypothetical protein
MDPVDMAGTHVTVTLSAPFIMIHEGCGMRFNFDNGDENRFAAR